MNRIFLITGTDTGAGKTVLTALLARFGREKGLRVAALKPLCSGGRADARALHAALDGALALDEINPWHFRRPLAPVLAARREKKTVRLADVLAHIRVRQKKSDLTLVEGAGGLLSPLGEDFDSRDLITALRAIPLIAAPNQLGVINHILLTLEALPKMTRSQAKVIFMSPPAPDAASRSNPELLAQFFPSERIFALPWLGKNWLAAEAVKLARVRRVLSELLNS
jgi:dethiobiotin synthetase